MADNVANEQLEKRTDTSEPDPIADTSMSRPLMITSLLLILTLVWSLYDEIFGQRPWKDYQGQFVGLYLDHLEALKKNSSEGNERSEKAIRESEEYKKLDAAVAEEAKKIEPQVKEISARVSDIDQKITDITEPFQTQRAWIAYQTYRLETASEGAKPGIREDIKEAQAKPITVAFTEKDGGIRKEDIVYTELEKQYNELRDEKARLNTDLIKLTKNQGELQKKRDDYLKNQMAGLSKESVEGLIKSAQSFEYRIRQINVAGGEVVDRCESCHLGTREPLTLTASDMGDRKEFVSHPSRDLLTIHDPEKFGCSTCHGGNGRGATSVEKAHGRYKHWLWPLYYKENVQAGCNQCHSADRVTRMADTLNRGKDLFYIKGCAGCHRYEGFDREADALALSTQSIKQLEMDRATRLREIRETKESADAAKSNEEARALLHRADVVLPQIISQIDGRISEFDLQSKYLMKDQKKIGPNLKEIKAKLRKEWLPAWLSDPQAFRPGTKMPTFRLDEDEVKAISAFLWQSAIDFVRIPDQSQGDIARGRDLFKSTGCLACHSIDGNAIGMGNQTVGGHFAANLSRVGEKANYNYIVRWVHNPRQRLAPYSPTLKKDLTPDDYASKKWPFVFDDDHSKSPLDGRELQVQNMTVMPNFRLSEQDSRDIASFLISLKRDAQYADASYLDDPDLRSKGERLAKAYGCAACHEIRGLEDEQRIGTELTVEGSKPIERLDFALLTEDAMRGVDPVTGEERTPWYNHKGFFEYKLRNPGIYDRGKVKSADERLRMPNIYLEEDEITALTTFLLGSVTASIPEPIRYKPVGAARQVQDGWWVVRKYNCVGCHNVLIGEDATLMGLPMYQDADGKEQLPPRLTTEGARVNPDWLLKFLRDPSLAGPQGAEKLAGQIAQHETGASPSATASLAVQPGANRNGVRQYLRARMPTFNFSPNELQSLVNFFMGTSAQAQPYIPERLDPLASEEQTLARALFTSAAAPCLKCHMTGDAAHDARATAPNFLLAPERLKPAWTRRWLIDPAFISPGTSMPSGLFNRDDVHSRWVFSGPTPPAFQTYDKDHVDLLVRYMFQITQEEQRRLGTGGGAAAPAATTGSATTTTSSERSIRRPSSRVNGP
jgi:cytochrome c2